jgi:XTP/dITP diphosphohydrolase
LAKARHASALSGIPALADDSGICVHALEGLPGVLSARYAGEPCNETANNLKLVEALRGKTDRGAHYVCALVFINSVNDPEPLIVQTRWYGQIVNEAIGNNGFGYDPYFFLSEQQCTAAQLEPTQKNLISHRGQALRELIAQLKSRA